MKGDGSVGYVWGGMAVLLLFFAAFKVADMSASGVDSKDQKTSAVIQKQPEVTTKAVRPSGQERIRSSTNVATMEVGLNPVSK